MKDQNDSQAGELTKKQASILRGIFESKYDCKLSDKELWEIHFNLKTLMSAVNQYELNNKSN